MGIRMSGIVSGLDTESIIKELMSAQSTKKTKIQNKITKQEWKQEKWKELNTKIYALYTGTLSKAKTQGSYLSKKVTSSDETKVTATAATTAVNGTHTVRVDQLAMAQYVTGSVLGTVLNDNGEETAVSGSTKLTQLGFSVSASKETMINISAGDKNVSLAVTEYTTVNDFLSACKSAGLNASYDTTQKRFFLAASDSGADNAFSITTSTAADTASKNAVRDAVGYSGLNSTARSAIDQALLTYKSSEATEEEKQAAIDTLNAYRAAKVGNDMVDDLTAGYDAGTLTGDAQTALAEAAAKAEAEYRDGLKDGEKVDNEELQKAIDTAVSKAAVEYAAALKEEFENGAEAGNPYYDATIELGGLLGAYAADATESSDPIAGNDLSNLGLGEVTYTKNADGTLSYTTTGSVSLVEASDSIVQYNGATLIGSSNTITANGLTLNLNAVTKGTANEYVSINVSKDSQAVYDMVKDFIKEYNDVLGALNDAYNADSARGYEPLTDEEREAMTEEQIEKWETKIKDSLLRRDSTLNSLLSSMKTAMQASVTYDGKTYSLASFGIRTTDYTEYGKLHIYGDADDSTVAGEKDKLLAAIEEDPDKVMEVLSKIAGGLYDTLQTKMKSTTLSSALTFYNDKQMSKELTSYKEELEDMEDYLSDLEDRYYKQFTAMETAMSKLNSQTNALASLLGTSTGQ